MYRQLIVLAAALLGACASQAPESEMAPAANAVPDRTAAPESAPAGPGAPGNEGGDGIVEALPVDDVVAKSDAGHPVVEAPNPVVCRLERRTGTNRKVKVCRRPATPLDEAETRQTFDSLRRSQMGEPR